MSGVGTTHHVSIGGRFYMVKPGSYQKRVAPQFGARFTTGDPDYNNLSMWQHWSQRCFVGGMDAHVFMDDAMYDQGVGVTTSEHEIVTLARDLKKGAGLNWSPGGAVARKFIVYNNSLYVVTEPPAGTNSTLWKWDPGTDGFVQQSALPGMAVRSIAAFNGKLFIGGLNTIDGNPKLSYSSGALTTWSTITNPEVITQGIYGMRSFQRKLYVAFGTHVWRLKEDFTYDGNVVFYSADQNSESNHIVSFEVHLGFLYFLSDNGHVHRTDGNSTFDIWSWDGQVVGVAIKSFDGRLFVAVNEFSSAVALSDGGHFGGLYQMSGSAVTQLKRWGKSGEICGLGSLIVYDRKLFYGASNLLGMQRGFGVAAYDPVEDAHSIFASSSDTVNYAPGAAPFLNFMVDDVFAWNGRIWASIRGHGLFFTPSSFRDRAALVALYDTSNAGGGWFISSTYDAGTPGLRKLWRKIIIDYELPNAAASIKVEFSVDNGATWVVATTVTTGTVQPRTRAEVFLNNIISVSLKLRISLLSTNSTYSPIFYGWIVSYIPVIEPNWLWTFTIVLAEKMQLLDGTTEIVDTEEQMTFLRNTYRTKQLVSYTDADSSLWATGGQPGVLIYDLAFHLLDLVQPLEGEVQVTLLEAVETY